MIGDGGVARSWRSDANVSSEGRVKTSRGAGIMAGGGREFTADGGRVVAGIGQAFITPTIEDESIVVEASRTW